MSDQSNIPFLETLDYGPMLEQEKAFVFRSWLRAFRGNHDVRDLDSKSYHAHMHRIVEKVMANDGIIVCRGKEDPEYLVGWLAADSMDCDTYALHAAYVRSSCRREGVFMSMLQHDLRRRACDPVLYVFTQRFNRWCREVLGRWGFVEMKDVWH